MDLVYNSRMEVNIHEAKTHLSRLLQRVASGEEVTIARAGVPIARIVPIAPDKDIRPLGMDRRQNLDCRRFRCPVAGRSAQGLLRRRTPRNRKAASAQAQMKYLLDTVVWIGASGPTEKIGARRLENLARGKEEIYLSAVSSWELQLRSRLENSNSPSSRILYSEKVESGTRHSILARHPSTILRDLRTPDPSP